MEKEKEAIKKQYINLLMNDNPHKIAIKITADLFAIDSETVEAILEDLKVIPKRHDDKVMTVYGEVIKDSVDSYYRQLVHYRDDLDTQIKKADAEIDRLKQEYRAKEKQIKNRRSQYFDKKVSTERKMEEIADYAKGMMEVRNETEKTR